MTAQIARAPEAGVFPELGKRIVLVLPYPISANRYWKAITIPGRTMMAPTKEAKAYKSEVGFLARQYGIAKPLDGRLALQVRLYPRRPQDWAKRARHDPDGWADTVMCIDLGNCEKVLSDALNGIAWHDDKQLHDIHLIRCEPDERGARVMVTIDPVHRQLVAPDMFGGQTA